MKLFKPKFWDKKQISLYSILLLPISLIIQLLSRLKNYLIKNQKCPIPTVCVGNIYLGGTGKTPLCIEIYNIIKSLNKNPVFIKKKYDSHKDEKNLLKQVGSVYESSNRIDAIKNAAQNNFEVAVLDDGFQDSSIKKDLSIICFNEKQWIGNGYTIPSGPLRENLSALNRADCVVINGKKNNSIEKKILEKKKSIKIFYSKYIPENLQNFKSEKVICFAGIGNPINFFNLLREESINIIEELRFPDHYKYSIAELNNLIIKAKKNDAILLTTEKDYLRIDKENRENISFLKIKVDIENKNEFVEKIKKHI